MTWFVTRRPDGGIAAAYQYQQEGLELEELPDDNADLVAFLSPSEPVPAEISDRQFYHLLALNGTITQAEALAAVATGTIPAALDAYVDTLPTDLDKFNARMLLSGAVSFNRHHPLTLAVGAAQGLSPEQLDKFWITASKL